MGKLRVLGLETSCDDTAAAVVAGGVAEDGRPEGRILSRAIRGQSSLQAAYGGIVPEIAARAHAEAADIVMEEALCAAGLGWSEMDAIAVTAGPGLAPALLAGVMTARGAAAGAERPLFAVNHLQAHALTPRLTNRLAFPYLTLLASGGHCLFAVTEGVFRHVALGRTRDDAPGEAFDKVARLLGLPQPGGPAIEEQARKGDPERFAFPRPLAGRPGCDLSFSGLKAAVVRCAEETQQNGGGMSAGVRADLAASFERAVRDSILDRALGAMIRFRERHPRISRPVLAGAGGVLANRSLRSGLSALCKDQGFVAVYPPPDLCTDNGAMVAWSAIEQVLAGQVPAMHFPVRARWPLESLGETN